jgi:hypothetical protein
MHASADLASPGLGHREHTVQALGRLGCTVSCVPQRLVLNLESSAFLRRSIEDRKGTI